MPVKGVNRYAVNFSSDDETLWFTLDRWYFTEEWNGIQFKDDVRCVSDSPEEFRLKLSASGMSIGKRLTAVEQTSQLVKYFMTSASAGNLKSGDNFSAEVYEITTDATNK